MSLLLPYWSSFLVGLLHAFEPNHGKSVLASYSLNKETTRKQLIALVSSLSIAHFIVLFSIATAIHYFAPIEQVEHVLYRLEWIAPSLVILFGGYLLFKSYRHKKVKEKCSCGTKHTQSEKLREATATGFIAGLIPCPTALTPLAFASLENNLTSAVLYIAVYIMGLMLSLTLLLFIVKWGGNKFSKYFKSKSININRIIAFFVMVIGLIYLAIFLVGGDHHH